MTVGGELDIATVSQLDRELRRAQAAAGLVVLDVRELESLDSIGLELMLAAARRARRAGGRFVAVCAPEVAWYLELIGIDRGLELADQPPSASAASEVFSQ